jgi:GTP cyclohydrolase FolE2
VIRNGLHVIGLLATVAVAVSTVNMEVDAHLKGYDLARTHEAIGELAEARDSVRVRVLSQWTPERVDRAARRERERRRQLAEALAAGTVAARL